MLENILRCTFTNTGLEVPGDINPLILHRFMRQSILDAHLPIIKPIGFALNASKKLHKQSATERCSYCLENMIEIASNLDNIVFLDVSNNRVISEQGVGEISVDKPIFFSNTRPVRTLYTQPHVMTTIKPLSIEIFVTENTGYKTMKDNSKIMTKDKFFPLNSYHHIIEFVRILPFNGKIQYKLLNGMTPEELRALYLNYAVKYASKLLSKEELQWVSSFDLCQK